jgi:hypothetical protein
MYSINTTQARPVTMNPQLHHRYHELLLGYWNRLRGDRAFPRENEINPEAIADIWSYCFLISVDEVTSRLGYRYSYLGKDLVAAYGDEVNFPEITSRLLSSTGSSMMQKLNDVLQRRQPVVDESEFTNIQNVKVKYRSCMLPLGDNGCVTHILGCMRWKMY